MPECSVGAFLFLDLYWTFFFLMCSKTAKAGALDYKEKLTFFFSTPFFVSFFLHLHSVTMVLHCVLSMTAFTKRKTETSLLLLLLLSFTFNDRLFFPLPLYFQFKHLASFQTLLNADAAVLSCDAGRLLAGGLLPHDQVYHLTQPKRKVSAHRPHRS